MRENKTKLFKLDVMNEPMIKEISDLYEQEWGHSLEERLLKHATYPGFTGVVIILNEQEWIGFAYGYESLPKQFYHELLKANLDSYTYQQWVKDSFEFVELVINPLYRKKGHAKRLIQRVLEEATLNKAILTVQMENMAAQHLYKNVGWKSIKTGFQPTHDGEEYLIMGIRW